MKWVVFSNKQDWLVLPLWTSVVLSRIRLYIGEKYSLCLLEHSSSLTWQWKSWVPRLFAGWYQMIVYGGDSTRFGTDRACVCLNNRVCAYCVRSKEVASFAQLLWNVQRLLSVCRLFSLVSISRKESTISTATVRIPWSSWFFTLSSPVVVAKPPETVAYQTRARLVFQSYSCVVKNLCVCVEPVRPFSSTGFLIWKYFFSLSHCSSSSSSLRLLQTMVITTFICVWMFYMITLMAQLNPLIGPDVKVKNYFLKN